MKTCPKCGETKSLDAFSVSRKNRDGLHGHCKACCSIRTRAAYAARGSKSWRSDSVCVRCNRTLPKHMFDKHGRSCRDCLDYETTQNASGLKQCNICSEWLPYDKFHPSKVAIYRTACAQCTRDYFTSRPDETRNSRLKTEYGITLDQYKELLVRQNHECPICLVKFEPGNYSYPVDHAHGGVHKNRIRAILHQSCNRFVMWTHEDSGQLHRAANLIDNPLTDWYVPGVPYNQRKRERTAK